MKTNFLKAVFWEYPQFRKEDILLKKSRLKKDIDLLRWLMIRFLENGRVADTIKYFSMDEIAQHLPQLRLSCQKRKEWSGLTELYCGN
ncbi:MAG: hypothetical protein GXO77_09075 [Calditrichaeota bacterium]|nr:hypothetical protein [Calditrichota bacterium]